MLRMRQRLELPNALRSPVAETGLCLPCGLGNARQKLRLSQQTFRLESCGFSGAPDGGEVHMRGQVLVTHVAEQIVAYPVAIVRAQSSVSAFWREEIALHQAIVKG